MDNLQVRLSKAFNLGWLVAAIEGEGSISLAYTRSKKYIQLLPRVNLVNTDKEFLEKAVSVCKELGIPCYVENKTKNISTIVWSGMQRVEKLLKEITPHLLGKQKRAEAVLEFINYRLSMPRSTPYGKKEMDLFFSIREMNGKGRISKQDLMKAFYSNPRDYTPNTVKGEDIVHSIGESD